jgi:hypothetical protein
MRLTPVDAPAIHRLLRMAHCPAGVIAPGVAAGRKFSSPRWCITARIWRDSRKLLVRRATKALKSLGFALVHSFAFRADAVSFLCLPLNGVSHG